MGVKGSEAKALRSVRTARGRSEGVQGWRLRGMIRAGFNAHWCGRAGVEVGMGGDRPACGPLARYVQVSPRRGKASRCEQHNK